MQFSPCTGNCTETGTHCQGCGRSHEAIDEVRQLVGQLAEYGKRFENVDQFIQYVAAKATGKARMLQMQEL